MLRLRTPLFATKALGNEREYQRIEGNSFRFGASGELRMHCFWNTSYEFPRRYTARICRRDRVARGLERGHGGLQRLSTILQRFFNCFSVGDTFSEVWKGNEKPSSFLGGERANFEWVVCELTHALCSIHEVDELLHVDWFDRTVGRYRKRFAIAPDKHTVAASIVPPTNAVLLCHGLKLRDLPVERTTPHGDEQFRCRVHAQYDPAGNIAPQVCAYVRFYGAERFGLRRVAMMFDRAAMPAARPQHL